jgi:hypothetical protein
VIAVSCVSPFPNAAAQGRSVRGQAGMIIVDPPSSYGEAVSRRLTAGLPSSINADHAAAK